ncbi:hypothetical protein MOX02_52570 [Methylobacterium oxalidis]|uniref:Uncharacterized protein n=1 Tax=Methylobacterium oxalidis TaxID=944322 RepID=A0A512JBG1_9HYPH|nr:hypothetical protein MOX02_52570 [Methylobacterium oxalidis]GLS67631.1 hypothetical protein GCM10007888_60150 [Methylobacterium oxalidis]
MCTSAPCPILQRLVDLREDERLQRGEPDREAVFLRMAELEAEALEVCSENRTLRAIRAALALVDLDFLRPASVARLIG